MPKRCELYLRLRADALPPASEMEALLQDATPAALLLTNIAAARPEDLRSAIAFARGQNLAILLENHAGLAREIDADGVHIRADVENLAETRRLLGDEKSIGASCVLSRHDAMVMAEAGADYIAFGEFEEAGPRDVQALAEMLGWWSELFQIPCVAWLGEEDSTDDIRALMAARPDYISAAIETTHFAEIRELAKSAADVAKRA